jgi:hypothetical protein
MEYPNNPKLNEFLTRWTGDHSNLTWNDVTMLLSVIAYQHENIRDALKFLKDATPKDRNGPCIRAIVILESATHLKDM